MSLEIAHGHDNAITVRRPIRAGPFPSLWKDGTHRSSVGREQINLPGLIVANAGKKNLFTLRRPTRG